MGICLNSILWVYGKYFLNIHLSFIKRARRLFNSSLNAVPILKLKTIMEECHFISQHYMVITIFLNYIINHLRNQPPHCVYSKWCLNTRQIRWQSAHSFLTIFIRIKTTNYSSILNTANVDVIRILCENGAKINVKCSEGKTPLHYTAQTGTWLISCQN